MTAIFEQEFVDARWSDRLQLHDGRLWIAAKSRGVISFHPNENPTFDENSNSGDAVDLTSFDGKLWVIRRTKNETAKVLQFTLVLGDQSTPFPVEIPSENYGDEIRFA